MTFSEQSTPSTGAYREALTSGDITNAQVRDALIALGLLRQDQWNQIDITGAQNGYFKNGLMTNLGITPDQFNAAKTLARWDGDPAKQGDIMSALSKVGIKLNTSDDAQAMFQRVQQIQSGQALSINIPNVPLPGQPGYKPPPNQQKIYDQSGNYIGPPLAPPPQGATPPAGSFQPSATPSVQSGIAPYRSDITLPPQAPPPTKTPGQGAGAGVGGPGGGTGAGTMPPPPPPTTPDDLINYIKQNAGAFAWFDDIPEIHDIITKIASQPGDIAAKLGQFEQQITQTTWWKNTSSTARQSHAEMRSDPGTWNSSVAQTSTAIGRMAANEGVNISPERLQAIATAATTYGWSPDQIKGAVSAEYHYDPTNQQQGATATSVKGMASKYLMTLSPQAIQTWTQQIMSGQTTADNFQRYLGAQAKTLFPWMSAEIDQGVDPTTFLEPYRQKIASTLEIDPNTVDWSNSKWMGLIQQKDPKTGAVIPPTYTDVERQIKTDPKYGWDKTTDALQTASGAASGLLKSFGMI